MRTHKSNIWTKLYEEQLDNNEMESTTKSDIELPPRNLSQRWRQYSHDAKRRVFERFSKWCPKTTATSNLFIYLKTDQTFPEFVLKSVIGFFGGIVLTYLCFVFFLFQLSISLIHATIISSIIGVLLTFGLAFSYRIRCLVFLLIPQLFSRVGRYTLTCYALVLILTGPATNTLKNSEVLTESMACTQEQIKASVKQITDSANKPFNSMKDTIKVMTARLKEIANKVDRILAKINGLVNAIVDVLQSSYNWLHSVARKCNEKFGTPYEHCMKILTKEGLKAKKLEENQAPNLPNTSDIFKSVCSAVDSNSKVCKVADFAEASIAATIKRRLSIFINHVKTMFIIKLRTHHSYAFTSNNSRTSSQVTAGIVTEIRNRADPLLTWLSWSSCVTSLFLLLIIFRAKYYQHMYETCSRYDNRYITKELRDIDLERLHEGRDSVLPLNRRERVKYVTTTSFRLVPSERVHLTRSMVFMLITTFKLMIHMVADYSLYWVLMTIRYHGKRQTPMSPGPPDAGILITGTGIVADMLRAIFKVLTTALSEKPFSSSCLPDPYPPDLKRYTQIGILIFLLWFFALFEPYGLRLRHLIMGHYRPERAKARAVWLYNHILRTRGSFMKVARRKLHKEYKYLPEENLTFQYWLQTHIPCRCLRYILGISGKGPQCLLCKAKEDDMNAKTEFKRCETPSCPGMFCMNCFSDIGRLCPICLTPVDYGDFSDFSLERGSSEDSDSSTRSSQSDSDNNKLLPKPQKFIKSKGRSGNSEHDLLLGNLNKSRLNKTFYSTNKKNNDENETSFSKIRENEMKSNDIYKHIKPCKLDFTQFSVPKTNAIVGYVYHNYFFKDNIIDIATNLLKDGNYVNKVTKPYLSKDMSENYGTFKKENEINNEKEVIIINKKHSMQTCRNRNINNIDKIVKTKYLTKLKARSKTFKVKRQYSQKYYRKRMKIISNIVKNNMKLPFICFRLPIIYKQNHRHINKTKSLKLASNTIITRKRVSRNNYRPTQNRLETKTNMPKERGNYYNNNINNVMCCHDETSKKCEGKNTKQAKYKEKRHCISVTKFGNILSLCLPKQRDVLKLKRNSQQSIIQAYLRHFKETFYHKRRKRRTKIPNKGSTLNKPEFSFHKESEWSKGPFERVSEGDVNTVSKTDECRVEGKRKISKIDYLHHPILSTNHPDGENVKSIISDSAKLSFSVKYFSLKNIKLFRNSITKLKSLLSLSTLNKTMISSSKVTQVTTDRRVYSELPSVTSCQCLFSSCQYEIIKKPTSNSSKTQHSTKNTKNKRSTKDKAIQTFPTQRENNCSCIKCMKTNKNDCVLTGHGDSSNETTDENSKDWTTGSSRTETTLSSSATVDYIDETRKIKYKADRKPKNKVFKSSNQSTETQRTSFYDVSTITSDWWSPIVEKKVINNNKNSICDSRKRKSLVLD